jgi:3-phosphoshikimate 1-carboxyvinyltransferase
LLSLPLKISLPRSKSIVIRCLIIHYLRTGILLPIFDNDPNDIKVVYNALKTIDSQIKTSVGEVCVINVEDCGAAYRFLMAVLATTPGKWLLTGTPRLLERPILPLVFFLQTQGANIKKVELGWRIDGRKLHIGNCEIDTSETSQFASAVMMVKQETRDKGQERNPYIRMTETILQKQDLANSTLLELADWSAAVFWIANALLNPNAHYLLKNLHFDTLQGDAAIIQWFQKKGLTFTENEFGIDIKHTNIAEIQNQIMNVLNTPDIAIIFAVLAVCYPFELTLLGLKNLNLKESKRLDITIKELSRLTIVVKQSEDQITIHKRTQELPKEIIFDSYNDHRFVMAWSLFKNFGNVVIQNPECVKKSYPEFPFKHYT